MLHCGDSVKYLESEAQGGQRGTAFDLAYLDSWDLDASNPWPAALHGLKEFLAVSKMAKGGSVVLIDDTPNGVEHYPDAVRETALAFHKRWGMWPGKGMLVVEYMKSSPFLERLWHGYQVAFRFKAT